MFGCLKKGIFVLVALLVIVPGLTWAVETSPIPKEVVESHLRDYVGQNFFERKIVKLEVTEDFGYVEGTDYPTCRHFCYFYWEGTGGGIYRETVIVDFVQVEGKWIFDRVARTEETTRVK